MSDELWTICFLDPHVIEAYRQKFYRTLGEELRANANALPCAFALMFVEAADKPADIRFNVLVGAVKELLPRGHDEAMAMLHKLLLEWEQMNYPDKVIISDTVGTA